MNLRDQLLVLEEELLSPATRHNPTRLAELLAPNFLEFGSSGRTFNRDEIMAELATETYTPPSLSRFNLVAHTADWALVTYQTSRPGGDPNTRQRTALRSSTWIHREGQWQVLFHQGTPVPPQP